MPSGNPATTWKSSVPASGQIAMKPPFSVSAGKMCQLSRSRPVKRTSATSVGLGSTVSPVMPMPSARRTAERPPSAATTYLAVTSAPEAKRTVTPSSSWARPTASRPRTTRPPSSSSGGR